ncbi:hypothetical protein [Pseudoxanthomonas sacheonensis]|uniref:DUF1579 domain-containing protein n=1 Tax=Pseudoxanthomonas sacheonensis TaxID=443615 RepID=A0ABU1RR03_9GAMM|nr:hypothetical protein [Pseudoxanthomonas sacheonensis]MDR6841202.1 hypothetical protein [Pseudoxanthomonas sacheonensis]
MADSNNHRAAELPLTPHPTMKRLAHLLGTWKNEGLVPGTSTYRMGLGGHYLIQEFEATTPRGRKLSGIEYITWDGDTQSLRSHLMADDGSNFTYTHQVDDDGTCWTWFGDKDSDNFFKGKLSEDGRTITGRWQWPGGGFDVVSRRTGD